MDILLPYLLEAALLISSGAIAMITRSISKNFGAKTAVAVQTAMQLQRDAVYARIRERAYDKFNIEPGRGKSLTAMQVGEIATAVLEEMPDTTKALGKDFKSLLPMVVGAIDS